MEAPWLKEFPGAVTVCSVDGTIIYMNDRAVESFRDESDQKLVGQNVLDCHPDPAKTMLRKMLESGERNVYTVERKGVRKLIYQSPWYSSGVYSGFVEMSLELPEVMQNHTRK